MGPAGFAVPHRMSPGHNTSARLNANPNPASFLPQDHWRKEWRGARHKEPAERVYCCSAPLDSYVTAGRGGQLRCVAVEACG